jgi:mono/diheme cytochrome c family protein
MKLGENNEFYPIFHDFWVKVAIFSRPNAIFSGQSAAFDCPNAAFTHPNATLARQSVISSGPSVVLSRQSPVFPSRCGFFRPGCDFFRPKCHSFSEKCGGFLPFFTRIGSNLMNFAKITLFSFATVAFAAKLSAANPTPAQTAFFEAKIRPILVDNCYKCHSSEAEKLKGGFSLEYRDSLLKGGDTGPAIVPGNPDKSLLITAVRYTDPDLQMPPKNKKLSATQIADLERWVKMGAPDPRVAADGATPSKGWSAKAKEHWAFKPVKKVSVPKIPDAEWPEGGRARHSVRAGS